MAEASHSAGSLRADLAAQVGALSLEVSLALGPGVNVLAGPNGAGKTTLVLLLLGLRRPARGRITLGERVLFDSEAGVDVPPERRGLGYVPQDAALFPHLDVLGNVVFALAAHRPGVPHRALREEAAALLEKVGAGGCLGRKSDTLSGGERQKVALARALGASPSGLLLDEPTASLDAASKGEIRAFLQPLLRTLGVPALWITHDPNDVVGDDQKIWVLQDGKITRCGTLAQLRSDSASAFLRAFAGRT